MKKAHMVPLLIFVLVLSLACNFGTGLQPTQAPGQETNVPTQSSGKETNVPTQATGNETTVPTLAAGKGPQGLTAEATSADSVKLSWQPVTGAASYRLAVSIADSPFIPIIDLNSSITAYVDYLALPGGSSKYSLEAVSNSGSIGQSVVDVTTPGRKLNPLTVDAQLDTAKSASAEIGPDGGSLSLADAKGVNYKLDIPAGALNSKTTLSLKSVKTIGGLPLDGGMLAAVKIEPDGLVLNDLATLSIILPQKPPSTKMQNLGFAFSGKGTEFHLTPIDDKSAKTGFAPHHSSSAHLSAPARQDAAAIVLETLVMYGVGIGQGTAQNAAALVQNSAPSDPSAAADQKQAAALAEEELAPLPNFGDAAASISALAIRLRIIGSVDCGSINSAIVAFQIWRRSAQYDSSQFPDQIRASDKAILDRLADKLKEIIDNASAECKKPLGIEQAAPDKAGCLQAILDHIANPPQTGSGVWNDLQTKMLNKFGSKVVSDADHKLAKCLPAYEASGGSSYKWSGTICSLKEPFKLNADGMEHFIVNFQPTSLLSGTMQASGTGTDGGITCKDGGPGTYKIGNPDGKGGATVIVTIPPSTLDCPGVSKSNTIVQEFTITRLAEKPASCSAP